MPAQWFYAIDDQEGGPVDPQTLKKLADTGQLKPTDQVWREGMPEWVAAGTIKNLCPARTPATSKAAAPSTATAAASEPVTAESARRTAPVTPAGEVRRDAVASDDDELEVEAPHVPPPDLIITPTEAARSAAADERKLRRKASEDDYLDYDEAFELGEQAKKVAAEASRDALAAFKTLLRNPVGGLDEAFAQLSATQAVAVGAVFALVFVACFFLSLNFLKSAWVAGLLGTLGQTGFLAFLKIGILSLLTPLGILAGCASSRAMFKGQGGIPSDVFLGGAALLPLAAFVLVDGLLGAKMPELAGTALVFAFCTTVLVLYSGATRIYHIPETAATLAVPIMLLLALWIPRIVAGAMF